jgi:site-specific recombinase XerD
VNRLFQKYVAVVNESRLARSAQPIPESANRIHALKHTRCSLLVDAGADFYKVALIAGHASLSSTLRYTHGSQPLACKEAAAKDYEIFA